MQNRFSYFVVFTVRCGYCNRVERQEYKIAAMTEVPLPALPMYWREVDGMPVCDKHEIVVKRRKGVEL